MRVRMKVDVSGTRNGQPWPPRGSVVDLPDDEAAHYCATGMAVPAGEKEPETATMPADDERRGLTTESGPTRKRAAKKDS